MKKILFILLIALSTSAISQNIRFEGIVKDSTNVALEMANVMAINNDTKAMDAYAITNDKGKFILNLLPNTSYTLKCSFIGFQTFEKKVTTTATAMNYDIKMVDGIEMSGTEVVYEMPVSISGDTIIYNSDSFTNGTERKLEDVLKKLPGVEVNSDGEITVEGKTVSKVMVEGKDFFDGDTKIATKNIPADALDKIQVLRNYNEVSNLKGLENNDENIAINIKLKEGKKNFWFGDMTAGAGVGNSDLDRYIVNPKLFYYSPKYSLNVIGNINNIGELPLTARDYFKFTGGFKNMMRKGGSSFNVSSNDLGILSLRNNQAKNIDTKFGAANFSYNPSKAWTLSGFGIFLGNKTNTETNSINDLARGASINTIETRQDKSFQKSDIGIFKLSSSYVPNAKIHFDYDAFLKTSNQLESQSVVSSELGTIFTNKNQRPASISQNINFYNTINSKHVIAIETQHLYQEEDPFYNANLQNLAFNFGPEYNNVQARNDISQERFIKTNKVDFKFDYYYMVTPKSNINVTLGNTFSNQNFNSHIFQILDNGDKNDLNADQNNNTVDYLFNDLFLGLHYKFIAGKFTFNPGFSVHNYNTQDTQLGLKNSTQFNRFLPDAYVQYQIKKSENLTYEFSMTNNFTDVVKLAQGFVFSNYNSLFSGNRNLQNSLAQVHSLRYFKYNMFNFENIFANLSYTKTTEAIKNKVLLTSANQVTSAVNIDPNFPDETINGTANYGRSFAKYYKASAGFNLNWSKFNNIRVFSPSDERIQTVESFTQNYNVRFSTNFKKVPNLGLKYTYTINDNSSSVFLTDNPSIDLEYFFLDAFSFVSEYSYFHNRNKEKTIDTEYDFLTSSLIYQKKDSKWEWKISGTNLLNTKALNNNSFNQLGGTNSFSSYIVQPRYIILSMKYNL